MLLPATLAEAQTTFYTAFGDSITAGNGDDPDRPEPGYPARLEVLLNGLGIDARVENRGVGGEHTPEGLTRLDDVLDELYTDVMILMEGTNDITKDISPETTRFNLNEMAKKAKTKKADMEVIHATLIPRSPLATVDSQNVTNKYLNELLRDLAGSQEGRLMDSFEVFGSAPDPFESLYADLPNDRVGHPNAAGYDLLAETLFDVLVGVDSVPPVTGLISPRNRAQEVAAQPTISVDIWDFGTGILKRASVLLVNGQEVQAETSAAGLSYNFSYTPTEALEGVVSIGVRSSDKAEPANSVDREVARFTIAGTLFVDGFESGDTSAWKVTP